MKNILTSANKKSLLDIANQSIKLALDSGVQWTPEPDRYPVELHQPGACFVTLKLDNQLRGCIGSLEAYRSLIDDVADNAYAAAFLDPRFPALTQNEYQKLVLSISVLSKPEPIIFKNETDLLTQIEPGLDGLILESVQHRGTFLPAVWESLQKPEDFLNQLKVKAGLTEDFWSEDVKVSRYRTEEFSA